MKIRESALKGEAVLKVRYNAFENFFGHSHLPLADERAIYQGKYTVINSSSCYFAGVGSYANYSGTIGCTEDKCQDYAQGLLVTVEDGITDVYRCDFHSNKEIKTK